MRSLIELDQICGLRGQIGPNERKVRGIGPARGDD
jgi:hypothetical protein